MWKWTLQLVMSDLEAFREKVLDEYDDTLVLVDADTETVITTAETMHELAITTEEIEYNEETAVLFTPWHEHDCKDIRMK